MFWGFQSNNAHVSLDWSQPDTVAESKSSADRDGRWVASPRIEFAPEGRTLVFDGGPCLRMWSSLLR